MKIIRFREPYATALAKGAVVAVIATPIIAPKTRRDQPCPALTIEVVLTGKCDLSADGSVDAVEIRIAGPHRTRTAWVSPDAIVDADDRTTPLNPEEWEWIWESS